MTNFKTKGNSRLKKKICFVATVEMAVKVFLLDHIKAMSSKYDIIVVVNTGDVNFLKSLGVNATVISVNIERKISIWRDFKALVHLVWLFQWNKFDVVHSIMPKSGFLAMLAGFSARIPIRIHTFTGQVWVTRTGLKRLFLKSLDRLLVCFATNILVDSGSQRAFLIDQGVVSEKKAYVLAKGSIAGVDTLRFTPNLRARTDLRNKFAFSASDVVFLFLGRLNKDKGVLDMAKAFSKLCCDFDNVHLMIVGPDEESMRSKIIEFCRPYVGRIHFEDYTSVPEQYMAAADVFCLPSYREGFGSVIIEAAAVGIPAIGTRIYGVTDAIDDGITGLLYEANDVNALSVRMAQFVEYSSLRKEMGERARKRVLHDFSKEIVVSAMLDYYESLFAGS